MKRFLLKVSSLFFLIVFSGSLLAQKDQDVKADTNSLVHFLKRGRFEGQARTFFMSTINEGSLTDYYALASGAGIGYHTAEWKGVSAGMSGVFIFNIASSDLGKADSLCSQKSRYEIGLFDITDPGNKAALDRFEELYIRYRIKNSQLIMGRQFINTPFINKQDGRMRPTVVEGVYLHSKIENNWVVEVGWLTRTSPRSTISWYDTGESIGIYSPGVNTDGTKSEYPGNTISKGIAIAGVKFKNKLILLEAWNTYVENIMNTVLLQPEIRFPVNEKNKYVAGVQYVYQNSTGNGGHTEISKRYYEKGGHTWAMASRLGYETPEWKINLNYLYINNHGRFLMPREWGREPFYTFLPRERNEGLGGVNAWSVNNELVTNNRQWKFGLGYGQYYVPQPDNFRLNKYGLPSYQQLNGEANYHFKGFLKNMDIQLLLVWKGKLGNEAVNAKYIFNRVNMLNSNLVMNYHF